jgi:hypothetical protein
MWVYHTPKLVSKNTCPEKNVDPPTKKQSSAYIVVKVMGERGKVPFFPEGVRSPKEVRSFALVLRYPWEDSLIHLRVHGESANDHSRRCNRSLPQ